MKIFVFLQARMGSSRLPGKVMLPICGKSVLEHDIERIKKSKKIDDLIICTTNNKKDDCIEDFCKLNNIKYYRGSENNVLERYYQASLLYKPDIIVRITSDCPLIDPNIIDDMILNYINIQNESEYYAPKYADPTKGHNFPDGFNPEIFSFKILEDAYYNASSDYDKEHVGPYMKRQYGKKEYEIPLNKIYENLNFKNLHLSLDTQTDYKLLTIIFNNLYTNNINFTIYDVLDFLNSSPKFSII
jgi:spore coat polysaccharide biosynthesis protein SpsF